MKEEERIEGGVPAHQEHGWLPELEIAPIACLHLIPYRSLSWCHV